jgi:hypothetical protein
MELVDDPRALRERNLRSHWTGIDSVFSSCLDSWRFWTAIRRGRHRSHVSLPQSIAIAACSSSRI